MNCLRVTLLYFLLLLTSSIMAQESQTAFNFLRVPVSAHATALGGENITTIEDDPGFVFNNPALLSSVSDKTIGLNFMTYMQGAIIGGASFTKVVNEKASWGLMAQYVNYGKMKQTTADNTIIGDFSANDVALEGVFSYTLTEKLVGGITAKYIASFIGPYNSMAVGVDLGLNYYNPKYDLSLSAVAKNLGGQLTAYENTYNRMPMDVQIGVSKGFSKIPFRLNATMVGLTDWSYSFINHFVVGVDILIGKSIYVSGGYNFRRAYEMKVMSSDNTSSSHAAGLSLGAGLLLDRFKVNVAWSKYHVSSNALALNLSFNL
ncbi:MAG: type IX secretion system protein PorQ [Bacteroidaceae bacterium]|nr:type IX secretion system protein PorQ [Bacteroidaceae bacterium]